ncbi:phosphotransferase [Paenibacillus sp. PR3]|uniref:Phosphotransferase n=1 Tax=Paenibacillus terricola TaxID=2763503 RepID=A0ABR8MZN3_9BACL|nr:phosphotransferase [Paenibacillus terricola]MBD3920542.1 phosphotransferase [Paenibacillus terricola]
MISPSREEERLAASAADKYGFSMERVRYLGGSQNQIYAYEHEGNAYIIRFTPVSNRTEQQVLSELDWIQYLADNGIAVSAPVLSLDGKLTEQIMLADGSACHCIVFGRAPGKQVPYPDCLKDNALYERLGELTGRLHALSRTYQPSDDAMTRRHDWSDNWFLRHIDLIPATQHLVRSSYNRLLDELRALSQDPEAYGLIHGDINVGNFTVDEQGTITLFDFDEAEYSWFVEDIAIQLYYLVYVYGGEEGRASRKEQAGRFMEHFMQGYEREYRLDRQWLRLMPLFLRVRELIVYIGAFRRWDGVDETFSSSDNQWFKDWIAESRHRIEQGIPIVDIWTEQ